jgi:hypothetical protein
VRERGCWEEYTRSISSTTGAVIKKGLVCFMGNGSALRAKKLHQRRMAPNTLLQLMYPLVSYVFSDV